MTKIWTVYILKCNDKTLYTGITNNLKKRISDHSSGLGAKYTRGRGPFKILYTETCATRSEASRRERDIKKMKREEKVQLCKVSKCRS